MAHSANNMSTVLTNTQHEPTGWVSSFKDLSRSHIRVSDPGALYQNSRNNLFFVSVSLYTFSLSLPEPLLLRPPLKECIYRKSLAAPEACTAAQSFDSFFGRVLGEAGSTLAVRSSREETHFISSQLHPTLCLTQRCTAVAWRNSKTSGQLSI